MKSAGDRRVAPRQRRSGKLAARSLPQRHRPDLEGRRDFESGTGVGCRSSEVPMRRRHILTLLAGAAASVPGGVMAQSQPAAGRLPVCGLLAIARTDRQPSPSIRVVRSALAALGWADGENFRLVVREGNGHADSVTPLIEELVRLPADVVVASGATIVSRLAPATRTVPIIMAASSIDPVRAGWATSYASPGGNVTGLTLANDEIVPKQVQLLKDAIPTIRHVGFVKTRSNPVTQEIAEIGQKTAAAMDMKASLGLVEEAQDVEPEIDRLRREGVDALLVVADPIIDNLREQIAEAANRARPADCRADLILC